MILSIYIHWFRSIKTKILGVASCCPFFLNVSYTNNSPISGNARYELKGKPFLSHTLRWTRLFQGNSNPTAVGDPELHCRFLTPRFAGRFTSAMPTYCVLDSPAAICGFAERSPLKSGGQEPLLRISTAAMPHSKQSARADHLLSDHLGDLSSILIERKSAWADVLLKYDYACQQSHTVTGLLFLGRVVPCQILGIWHTSFFRVLGTLQKRYKTFFDIAFSPLRD